MPLSSFEIVLGTTREVAPLEVIEILQATQAENIDTSNNSTGTSANWITANWFYLLKTIYLTVFAILLVRIMANLATLIFYFFRYERVKKCNCVIIYNSRLKNSFSFFNWIFIKNENPSKEDFEQILSHEKIHASQYHSLDLIVFELLSAVMWFNPFVWRMKSSMQLLHEYLADEGALGTGIDRLKYQALLINQVTGEKLICLSSGFNQSLIKKRMIMMTKSNFNQKTKLKILTLFPASVVIFIATACLNGLSPSPIQTEPTVVEPSIILKNDTLVKGEGSKSFYSTKEGKYISCDSTKTFYILDPIKSENENQVILKNIKERDKKGDGIFIRKSNGGTHLIRREGDKEIENVSLYGSNNILYLVDNIPQSNVTNIEKIELDEIKKVRAIANKGLHQDYKAQGYDGAIEIITINQHK
jgi:hypothetical protein